MKYFIICVNRETKDFSVRRNVEINYQSYSEPRYDKIKIGCFLFQPNLIVGNFSVFIDEIEFTENFNTWFSVKNFEVFVGFEDDNINIVNLIKSKINAQ